MMKLIKLNKEGAASNMQTKRWNVKDNDYGIEMAATLIRSGSTIAFPTETVYGLGADATNEEAVMKIFIAKGRPQDNPLIVHVATRDQLINLVSTLPKYVDKLIDSFTPGPITFVLPSNGTCAQNVSAGLSTIAVRIPDHPVAQQFIKSCALPIAAPSANISGKPSPTTADHVWEDLSGKIAGLLDDGETGVGMESTVLDCTKEIPIILRPGGITKEQIEKVTGDVHVFHKLENKGRVQSPGMKYKHYSPEVPLWLVKGTSGRIQHIINFEQSDSKKIGVLASTKTLEEIKADEKIDLGDTLKDVAANLYNALRSFKSDHVDLIICESFPEEGIGQAIMNRLNKAADKTL